MRIIFPESSVGRNNYLVVAVSGIGAVEVLPLEGGRGEGGEEGRRRGEGPGRGGRGRSGKGAVGGGGGGA